MTPQEVHTRAPFTLRDYLGVLGRRWWIVLGVTAIVFGVGVYRSDQITPAYQAQGQLEIVGAPSDTELQTQIGIIASPAVHDSAVQAKPGIGRVRARQDGLGNIVTLTATSSDARVATRTVNATIDAYVAYVQKRADFRTATAAVPIQGRIDRLQIQLDRVNAKAAPAGSALAARRDALIAQQSALQQRLDNLQLDASSAGSGVNVIARPDLPTSPIRPNHRTDGLIALGAGLLLGIVLAFFFEYLVRSSRKPEPDNPLQPSRTTDIALMGILPPRSASDHDVVALTAPESPAGQSYRSLQNAASFLGLERGRCLVVTSAPDRTGKTETVANLAVVLARARRRVIVVDCDLREPRLHESFGISNSFGFTSVVRGEQLADVLWPVPGVEHLYVLPAGPPPENSLDVLASDRCREVIASLLVGGTLVLIDTPPTGPDPDTLALVQTAPVDAVMLVASAGEGATDDVRGALDALSRAGVPKIGVVHATAASAFSVGHDEQVGRWPRTRRNGRASEAGSNGFTSLAGRSPAPAGNS